MRIAYVEDNPTNLALVERIARMTKHNVVSYSEGEIALESLKQEPFDLILMDVELAGEMNGLEVVRQLRAHGLKTPIVAVTAYAMMGDRDRCLALGCDDYLPKPLPINDFIALLQRYDGFLKAAQTSKPAAAPATLATTPTTPTTPIAPTAPTVPTAAPAAPSPVLPTPAPAAPVTPLAEVPATPVHSVAPPPTTAPILKAESAVPVPDTYTQPKDAAPSANISITAVSTEAVPAAKEPSPAAPVLIGTTAPPPAEPPKTLSINNETQAENPK